MSDAELAALGPFFATERRLGHGDWRRLRTLLAGPVLAERVRHVRTVLTRLAGVDVEERVAASTMSLGLFARIVSPVVGAAVLDVPLPRPSLDEIWWQPVERGPLPLALTGSPIDAPDFADLLTDVLTPLAEAVARHHSVSRHVMTGNIASAVFGALHTVSTTRPDLAARVKDLGTTLLEGPLAHTGELGERFVRSSCCLYYRIPGGGFCGDCVLARRGTPGP